MSDTDRLTSMEERFWRKVDKSGGAEACWLWSGSGTGVDTVAGTTLAASGEAE